MNNIRKILDIHYNDPENLLLDWKGKMVSVATIQMIICPEDSDEEISDTMDKLAGIIKN